MNSISPETVPQIWNDRDEQFSPSFCYGASVLLASYDDDAGSRPQSASTPNAAADYTQTHQVLA